MNRPSHVCQKHWEEWVVGSAIDPQLTALNLASISGQTPYEYLFFSDKIKRLNTNRLPTWILKKYHHIEQGGWWASGIDLLTGEDELWGCFKPNKPRINAIAGKYQKYEHPLKAEATLLALRVPLHIWEQVSKRYDVPLPANVAFAVNGEALGFWSWVIANPKISITLTEGCKKAAALLSIGFAAIGLPGIWGGYRKNNGKPCLLPQLEVFAKGERQFYFAFDQDEKQQTRKANRMAVWCTAKLLKDQTCNVSIISWEPWIKGCDELIVAKGGNHFVECYSKALSLENWQADRLRELSYKPALRLDSSTKYIGDFVPPPSAKLICLKAPKGSGKTEWLVKICAEAQTLGQKVLVLTHRQQLGQALCSRFGIDYVTELTDSDTKGVFGFGLCFDSLRQNSQARFNPDDWHDCIIILDECEQSIWHLLSARTEVSKHRVQVLRNFQALIQNTLESAQGKIFLADADLSDLSVDYIRSLANFPVEPWIAVKEGNPTPWDVTIWETCNELLGALVSHIRMRGRSLIFVDGQKAKSKWGTQNLEAYLAKLFPELRILRIDAESVADPNHPAFGCIDKLNAVLPLWDIVIASPSIETGVSIDIKGHFTSVWDIAQGVVPVPSILQRMARLREPVPRHTWAKGYGIGRIGNGSTSPRKLMESQQTQFKAHVKLLAESEFPADFEAASSFQPQSLRTWAKMAARINLGMVRYRHEIIRALIAEGHSIKGGDYLEILNIDDEAHGTEQIKDDLTESRDKIYEEHCQAVSMAPTPDEKRYESLTKKQQRTKEELKEFRKGELSRRYSEELVSPTLVELDDDGEYQKARLHYYLTSGREFLAARDQQVVDRQLESGEGEVFLPDVNRSLIGGKIILLEALDIKSLLQQNTEWSNDSQVLIDLSIKSRQVTSGIKSMLGVTLKEDDTPVAVAQKILRQCLGLAFSTPIKRGAKGHQQRFYQPVEVPPLRQKILDVWLARDEAARVAIAAQPESVTNGGLGSCFVSNCDTVSTLGNIYSTPELPTETAAYQREVPTGGEPSLVGRLSESFAYCLTPKDLALVIEGFHATSFQVEDAIALQGSQPRRQQLTAWYEANLSEDANFCLELLSKLEAEAAASEDELIVLFEQMERRGQRCELLLPGDFWQRASCAIGQAAEALERKESQLESAVRLLRQAILHGADTVRCVLFRWAAIKRWEAVSLLEEKFPLDMQQLATVAPNWAQWCAR
jgi:hypothetical protein